VSDSDVLSDLVQVPSGQAGRVLGRSVTWRQKYVRQLVIADFTVAVVAVVSAAALRFGQNASIEYLLLSALLPTLWMITLRVVGGYEMRFLGTGSDEFRKVLNSGVGLTGVLVLTSYAVNNELSRVYLVISMPLIVALDLLARFALRKRLHRLRRSGLCMSTVVAVGHEPAVAGLIRELRREPHHGLAVVAACVGGEPTATEVAEVPVVGDLDDTANVARLCGADSVAVLSCPEMDGLKLRQLAWELEKTGTDLCVAPALLDVAGPRTTIRPTAGLTLLHVDHPQLSGPRQVLKDLFDRCAAAIALILLSPVMITIALSIKFSDSGPALFTQTRVGKDGQLFKIYKFRTMVVDAEKRFAELQEKNENDGVIFKIRHDPRITALGTQLRRRSLDELPQLFNVLLGEMSLVGPRPALPDEAARYADHVRRRLVVKPGVTGMWQVNGRSTLSWDETVRLDLRYVENWSLALDLQILWKTLSVVFKDTGAW
jgi:exopolysaccharide biosynthesis polyprenyl glycosylphosphotransferase